MPIYEYLCQDCSYKFELKQSIKEDPVAICTRCGKSVNRIISAPAIMFKGSGWYVTDYSDKLKPPTGESSTSTPSPKKDTAASSATAPTPTTSTTTPSSNGGTGTSSTPSSPSSSTGNSSSST